MRLTCIRAAAPTVLAAAVISACAPAGAATPSSHAHLSASSPQSETTALESAKWTSNVTVTPGDGDWTFRSNGMPEPQFTASHYAVPNNPLGVSAQGAQVIATTTLLRNQNYDYTLPLTPQYSSTTTTNLGAIGVMLDGAVLYNPYEANDSTVATANNFKVTQGGVTASFLDNCDSHPGPGGQFHYHGMPACLVAYATTGTTAQVKAVTSFAGSKTPAVAETNAAAKEPVLVGFAFDGYGIYDNIAMNGKTIPVSALDSCNGIFSPVPGYPNGIYHYVLENAKSNRSSIGCYHGVVSSAYTRALGNSITALLATANISGATQQIAVGKPEDAHNLAARPGVLVRLTALFKELSYLSYCG